MLKHSRRLLQLLLLVLMIGLVCYPAQSQARRVSPKTVDDYFLLLPEKFFEIPMSLRKQRLYSGGAGVTIDRKNDYLTFPGDAGQPSLTVALFRYQGTVLVGVYAQYEMGEKLEFLRYNRGRWSDATKQVLPVPYNERYEYKIPRSGTTIRVIHGEYDWRRDKPIPNAGKRVYDLIWSGGKFHVRR